MNRNKLTIGAVALGAVAALALGQNAGNDSAGPTRNDYRLQIVEPAEGATVSGSTVRVVVNTEIPSDIGETRRDVNTMPRPDVDVFLDDENKGSMRDANNVLTIDGVAVGDHTIVLLAKNRAGEIIGRKVVHFASTTAMTASAAPVSTERPDATLVPVAYRASDAPAPQASTQVAALAPMPRPAAETSAPADTPAPKALPKTATSDPLLLTAGALLLLGGLGLRRIG
jgi:hypothetical protein